MPYDKLVARLRNAAQWADKGLVITPSVCLEAADAIEELALGRDMYRNAMEVERGRAEKKQRWIPVTERFPDNGESVLVYRVQPRTSIDVCPYLRNGVFSLCGVAYWMPLPAPPKEG